MPLVDEGRLLQKLSHPCHICITSCATYKIPSWPCYHWLEVGNVTSKLKKFSNAEHASLTHIINTSSLSYDKCMGRHIYAKGQCQSGPQLGVDSSSQVILKVVGVNLPPCHDEARTVCTEADNYLIRAHPIFKVCMYRTL